jgi:hypothetical protein
MSQRKKRVAVGGKVILSGTTVRVFTAHDYEISDSPYKTNRVV